MEREILIVGNPLLRRKAKPVTEFNAELKQLADTMLAAMFSAQGIGLAAPQVGEPLRLIIVGNFDEQDQLHTEFMVNPEILETAGNCEMEEGCLSVPGIREQVSRPERITVEYQDLDGQPHRRELTGLEARVCLHENDHLEGVLFIDRISPVRRGLLQNRLKQLARDGAQA